MLQTNPPFSSDSTLKSSNSTRSNSSDIFDDDMVFGNPSFMKSPKKMGKLRTFIFINNQPIFVIGFNKSNSYSIIISLFCPDFTIYS